MALDDRDAIMEHIAKDNWAAAIQLDDDFEVHADRACKTPMLYKPGRMKGTREIVVHPNDVMVYQVTPASVVVLRVLHTAQQWPPANDPIKKGRNK